MSRQRGFLELTAIVLIGAAVLCSIIGVLWWRLDVVAKDRDDWKHKAEVAPKSDAAVTGYFDEIRTHASEPDVAAAVAGLCDDLRVPAGAGAAHAPARVDAGHRRADQALAADLLACQTNAARLRALQGWLTSLRE